MYVVATSFPPSHSTAGLMHKDVVAGELSWGNGTGYNRFLHGKFSKADKFVKK